MRRQAGRRSADLRGFVVLPRRWVVERTFGWMVQYRRLSKDDEFHPATREALIHVAMIHLMLCRWGPLLQQNWRHDPEKLAGTPFIKQTLNAQPT
ncbi:MAG: transposase [Gemmataceae bacterium]|nr:transposase [Gemmataceae bacterium]